MEQRNEELFRAVKDGRLQSVIRCLKYGADINCQTQDGDYPIHIAAAEGYTEIVQLLLDRGIDCNLKARHTKSSPLHLAAERGHLKTTELLLMGGGNPNNKNWRGESPLHRAAGDGHLNVVVLLLNANSDHNMAAKYGRTPLFYAVESGRLNTTSVLLERGSDSNLKNIFGDTVLHLAAECKHPEIFRILLTSGSDPRIRNNSGETPIDSFKSVFRDSVETSYRKLDLTVLEMLELIQEKEREKEEEARILEELRGLGLETASDMLEVIKLGHYKCYWNRVYLVGPFYSGKSCLAKILVGEPIPKERESTDGIWIYMGKAGMDIEETKWKCFPKGDAIKEVLTSMLMSISKPENIETPVSHFHTSQTDLTLISTIERRKKHVTKVDMEFEDKTSHMNPVVLNKSFDTPILKSNIQHFPDDKNNISDFSCNTSCWQDNQPSTSPVDIDSTVHECYVASKINERNDFGGLPVDQNASDDLNNDKKEYRGLPIDKSNTSDVLDEEPNNFGGLPFDCNATNMVDNAQLDFGGSSVDCSASHAVDNEQKKYARLPVDISASHMQAVDNKPKNFGELPVYHTAFYHSNEESKFNASSYNLLEESNISNLDINVQDNSAKGKYMLEVPDAVKGSFIGVPTSARSLSTATIKTRTLPIVHLSDTDPNDFREAPINPIVSRVSTEKKRLSSSSNKSELVQYKEKIMEQITSELSHKNIHQLVTQAIADGKYKQTVIPIDIWDFGGQKDYYMTHQLFITSRGIFVLIFNGSLGLHKTRRDLAFLPGHFGKPTVAVYLIHWVNSILTYSKRLDEGFPRILFVATHKDKISEKKLESHRNKLMDQIEDLFKSHAGRAHLEFKPLLFINAINENDPEIEALRMLLMNRAVEHPRWGELMPTTWVPLELQLLMEVENGVSIMSKAELKMLNSQNEPMVLTEKQLETFLRVQHSLGKILYFNTTTLRNYVIIKPAYLVEVLRSIVTEKQFWIKGKQFSRVLQTLRDTGFIDRWDIYSIWNQVSFKQILPYKVFMIEVLVHLDVLVAPQTENEDLHHNIDRVSRFLVPCMITRPNKTKYMKNVVLQKRLLLCHIHSLKK